jgi:very-short-patch-repair endonuclease
VEYDGQEFHNKRKKQRDRDRKRRKWLRDHGWTVIVLTKDSFTAEAIGAWMDELRVALRIRR